MYLVFSSLLKEAGVKKHSEVCYTMKKQIVFFAVVAVLALTALVIGVEANPALARNESWCNDSDGGIIPLVYGWVDSNWGTFYDACMPPQGNSTNSTTLQERFCADTVPTSTFIDCSATGGIGYHSICWQGRCQ